MFQSGWQQLMDEITTLRNDGADARSWFGRLLGFCVEDPARFQLMLQRPVPGFTPSDEAMALSQAAYDAMRGALADFGVSRQVDVDLIDSMLLGLAGNQVANDPGGRRYVKLADEAVELLLRHVKRRTRR
jgi:hypothetical protein